MNPSSGGPPVRFSPVQAGERIETLDVLRGFALLWIFLFNVFVFSGYEFLSDAQVHAFATFPVDATVKFLRHLFIENKDFSLFSFMFGVGFGIMARRARRASRSVAPLFLRRQAILLGIGLAHAILLWGGDILVIYAVLGLFLLPFLQRSDKTVLISAATIYLLPIPLYALSLLVKVPAPYTVIAKLTGEPNLYGIWMNGFASADYGQVVHANVAFLVFWWAMFVVNLYWPDVLGMFLLGLYVGRSRWLERIEADPGLLPGRLVVWAGGLGIAGNIVFAILTYEGVYYPPSGAGMVLTVVQYLTVPLLCFFYMAGLTWLFQRERWRRVLRPLAAVGRMTLTNYLMESVICMFIFYGVGLGLFAEVGAALAVGIGVIVFLGQVLFSLWWWSAGFAYGPAEWLWRLMSYGVRLPLRSRSA